MPKRKVWNEGTSARYAAKAVRMAGAQIPPHLIEAGIGVAELQAMASTQTRGWEGQAGVYRRIRDMARRVMVRSDTKVEPIFRAPYFAFAQRLWKLCVVTGEKDPDEVIADFKGKSDIYNDAILTAIVDELGLGKKEVVGRAAGA